MQEYSQIVTWIFSSFTVLGQISAVFLGLLLAVRIFQPKDKTSKKIASLISNNYIVLIFLITAAASAGSLFLSDIMNYLPCKLCWYQRIFIYPQVIISGVALFTADTSVRKYLLPLSIVGALIAVYHILLQIYPSVLQCGDETVSCSTNQFVGFGYITIPVMSLTAFIILIFINLMKDREDKN